MPTNTYERKNVGELEKGLNITNSVYYKGMFIYAASDLSETKTIVDVVKADPDLPTETINQFKKMFSGHQFTQFKTYKDKLYAFDKKTKTIFELTNGTLVKKTEVPTPYLIDFAVSDNNVFLNYTDLKQSYYTLNGQNKNEFTGSTYPIWLDENQLLVLVKSNLHIYNVEKNKLEPVLSGVSSIFTDYDKIYVQDATGNSYIKTIEILNR